MLEYEALFFRNWGERFLTGDDDGDSVVSEFGPGSMVDALKWASDGLLRLVPIVLNLPPSILKEIRDLDFY